MYFAYLLRNLTVHYFHVHHPFLVFPGSDSFHPLLAEVTHNETADASTTFHLLEHKVPNSPEGQPASGERNVSAPSEESETQTDPSVEFEQSPERFRTEKPALHESYQRQPHESVLMLEDTMRTDVELTALSLSNLTMRDDAPAPGMPQLVEGALERNRVSERPRDSVASSDLWAQELKSEHVSNLRNDVPVSDKILVRLNFLVQLIFQC